MKQTLRGFGLAFFIIGAFITAVHSFQLNIPFVSLSEEKETSKKEIKQIEQLESQLKEANNQIAKLEEQLDDKGSKTTSVETSTTTKKSTDDDGKVVHGTLKIYSGITPYVVGQKLEDLGIVENGVEVEMFLARPEYSRSIQVGEFDLHSNMSIEEIAKVITGKAK